MLIDNKSRAGLAAIVIAIVGLSACSQMQTVYPTKQQGDTTPTWGDQKKEGLFGKGGIDLMGNDKKKTDGEGGAGIGVNALLWRASLDTIGFMPLASEDAFGGVIITDWYAPPENPTERFKMTVFILDRTLRADGVRVSVFRQVQNSGGDWVDSTVSAKTATDLENTILTRARELRASTANAK